MFEWINSLSVGEMVYFFIAIPSTLLLLLQSVLALVGVGGHHDADFSADHDFDGGEGGADELTLFSVRGIMSGLCVMGWSGFVLLRTDMPDVLSIIMSLLLGILAFLAIAFINRLMQRMQSSGNIIPANAIGRVGQVYLQIPGNNAGTGKVNVLVQDKLTEFSAITAEQATIKTGESVRVVAVNEMGILTVERVPKDNGQNAS